MSKRIRNQTILDFFALKKSKQSHDRELRFDDKIEPAHYETDQPTNVPRIEEIENSKKYIADSAEHSSGIPRQTNAISHEHCDEILVVKNILFEGMRHCAGQ